jgi:hypothetical protein
MVDTCSKRTYLGKSLKRIALSPRTMADLITIGLILFFSARFLPSLNSGIDFTDEGKYLNDALHPNLYSNQVTQYGHILNPIFRILNYDLHHYRILNFGVIFLLGSISFYLIAYFINLKNRISFLRLNLYAVITGLLYLNFFSLWIITPNYNSLTFQFVILTWLFFSIFFFSKTFRSSLILLIFATLVLSCLLFIKPTTFIALSGLILFSLIMLTSNWKLFVPVFFATSIVAIFLLSQLFFGHYLAIFSQLRRGLSLTQTLDPQYKFSKLIEIDSLPFSKWVLIILFLMFCYLKFISSRVVSKPKEIWRILLAPVAIFVSLALWKLNIFDSEKNNNFYLFVTVVIMLSFSSSIKEYFGNSEAVIKFQYILPLLPFVYSLGTNRNQWEASGLSISFLVLFSILRLGADSKNQFKLKLLHAMMIAVAGISVLIISHSSDNPYRQPNELSKNSFITNNVPRLSGIRLNEDFSISISNLVKKVYSSGFISGTPIIDLSGQSPMLIYVLEGQPVGSSWLIGGYPESLKVAYQQLKLISCTELGDAWILDEPSGPRSFEFEDLLGPFGLEKSQYEVVASWSTPIGSGGYDFRRKQNLMKPSAIRQGQIGLRKCKIQNS